MVLDLTGKRALITGASRGIGRAIAEVLHSEGCRIAMNARQTQNLAAAAAPLAGASVVAGDVTDPDQAGRVVSGAIAALGGIDILVCNVGSGTSVPPGQETAAEWQRVFAVNLWSTTNMVECARDALQVSRGCIVCISSICGLEVIEGAPATYSVAKAALHAYVRAISRPLGKRGIRINAVAPGNILFDGSVWSRKLAADAASVNAMLDRQVALARLGTPREVADLVAYLASGRAAFATGSVWTLDGGQVHA